MKELIAQRLRESAEVKLSIIENDEVMSAIENTAKMIIDTYEKKGKVIICGNGGSASDALHFAGELNGRFQTERGALPAVVLNADVATLTAIANDYGYENAFARQASGYVRENDLLVGISTSGNSGNVIKAIEVAKELGGKTVAFLGGTGGAIKDIADESIIIPVKVTARTQESHITIIHILCEFVDRHFTV